MGTIDSSSWSRIQQGFRDTERLVGQQQFNMAMVKARQTLEVMVKCLGDKALIVEGDLADNIDQLFEGHWISPATKDHYHRIRVIGNKAVHDGDESSYDANEVLELLSQEVQAFANTYSGGRRTVNSSRPAGMDQEQPGFVPQSTGSSMQTGSRPVQMGAGFPPNARGEQGASVGGGTPQPGNRAAQAGIRQIPTGGRPGAAQAGGGQRPGMMGAGQRAPQTGAGQRTPQAGAGQRTPQTGAGQRTPQTGAGQRTPQTGAGQRAPQAGAGQRAPQTGAGQRTPQAGAGQRATQTGAGQRSAQAGGRSPQNAARNAQRPGSGSNHSRRRAKKKGFDPYDLIKPGLILLLIIVIVLLLRFIFAGKGDEKTTTAAPTSPEVTTEAVVPTETPTTEAPTEAPKVYKTTSRLNVRTEPSTDSSRLGTLAAGTVVEYVDTYDDQWTIIMFEGQQAYVSTQYLTAEESAATEPAATQPAA